MKRFKEIGTEIGKLVQEKNEAYGDSFAKSGEILRLLYPDGIKPEQYDDALAVVRVVDKLFRIATRKDAFGESPWRDIAGYGILGTAGDESTSTSDERENKVNYWSIHTDTLAPVHGDFDRYKDKKWHSVMLEWRRKCSAVCGDPYCPWCNPKEKP